MRDYQLVERKNPYWMEPSLWRKMLFIIKDYPRMKKTYDEMHLSANGETKMRLEKMKDTINAIEKSWNAIPEEYRKGIYNAIVFGMKYPFDADVRTYGRWKARYVHEVADRLGEVL